MAKEKGSFKEFLSAIAPEHQAFVEKLRTYPEINDRHV